MDPISVAAAVTFCSEIIELAVNKLDVLREAGHVQPIRAREYGLEPWSAESRMFLSQMRLEAWGKKWSLEDGEDREQPLRRDWGDAVYDGVIMEFAKAVSIVEQLKAGVLTDDELLEVPKRRRLWWKKKTDPDLLERRSSFAERVNQFGQTLDEIILLTESSAIAEQPSTGGLPVFAAIASQGDKHDVDLACESIVSLRRIHQACTTSTEGWLLDLKFRWTDNNSVAVQATSSADQPAHDTLLYHLYTDSNDLTPSATSFGNIVSQLDDLCGESYVSIEKKTLYDWAQHEQSAVAGGCDATCYMFQQTGSSPFYLCMDSQRGLQQSTRMPLGYILERGDTSTPMGLSYDDKLFMAYRLAQAAMYLTGTPYLHLLKTDNICIASTANQESTFMLSIPSQQDTIQELTTKPMSEYTDLYQFGGLLVEIALGRLTCRSEVILENHASVEDIQRLTEVEREMGLPYRAAAAFCLQGANQRTREAPNSSSKPRRQSSDDHEGERLAVESMRPTLCTFYDEVIIRLESLLRARETDPASRGALRQGSLPVLIQGIMY